MRPEYVRRNAFYWTSTAWASDANSALALGFSNGGEGIVTIAKSTDALRWCVRGPGGDYPGTP